MVSASLHPKLSSSFVLLVYFGILCDDLCFILRSLFFFCKTDDRCNLSIAGGVAQPSFLVTPQDQVVTVGRRAVLRCQVTGNPAPAVFWNKQSSQVIAKLHFTGPTGPDPTKQSPRTLSETRVWSGPVGPV